MSTNHLSPESIQYRGTEAAIAIEQLLNVPHASLVPVRDLVMIAATALAKGDVSYSIEVNVPPAFTHSEDLAHYLDLIRRGSLSASPIAEALRALDQNNLTPEQEKLMRLLGQLYAEVVKFNPQLTISAQTSLDVPRQQVLMHGLKSFQLPRKPTTLVDLGPGMSAFARWHNEFALLKKCILVEKGAFQKAALQTSAELAKLSEPKVTVRADGIAAATTELLNSMAGRVDVILASGIHDAGRNEIVAGIQNAAELLAKGGTFVLRCAELKGKETLSATDMLNLGVYAFGKDPAEARIAHFGNNTTGKSTSGVILVFVK